MTSPTHRRMPERRQLLQAAAIAGMLVVFWLFVRRGEPERVMGLEDAPINHRLFAGTLYRPAYKDFWNSRGPVIVARTFGRPEKVILEEDTRVQFAIPAILSVDAARVVYAVVPFGKPGAGVSGFRMLPFPKRLPALPSVTSPPPSPPTAPPVKLVRLRELPLSGGAARDVLAIRAYATAMAGGTFFYLRPQTHSGAALPDAERQRGASARADLVAVSLSDRSERLVRARLGAGTSLMPGANGVFWAEPRTIRESTKNLFYARALDCAALRVGTAAPGDIVRWSAECGGCVYWFQSPAVSHGSPTDAGVIICHDLARSSSRIVFAPGDFGRKVVPFAPAAAVHGSLFLLVTDGDRSGVGDPDRACLCRLTPGRREPVELIRRLPGACSQFQFDHDYLYYVSREKDVGPWQALTDDSPGPLSNVLYRIALP